MFGLNAIEYALGRIAFKPAQAPIAAMLAQNGDKDVYLRHAGSLALASIGDGTALEALAQHESSAVRLAAVVALRRMRHAGAARFLGDADERVVTEAARAINDDGGIEAAVPALAAVLKETRFTSEPLLRPEPSEREGYVPNVVYTCGAMAHGDQIILPYAVSDTFSNFATIKIAALMRALS